ncbi:YwaF family protein [Metabacillus idriensis]|uniref:YwaF family protein n=1 Tax=Metabacillus idriensis TaxID=324768 RepID=UPI00174AEBC2|nr:TIGR02206 family membrane protein [Metabacillus idriensis]
MNQIFQQSYEDNPFAAFSKVHLLSIFLLFLTVLVLFLFRKKLLNENRNRAARWILAGTGLVCELSYHLWLTLNGTWNAAYTLPLELCSISLFLCIVLLLTKSRRVFEVVYFIGLAGAFFALLTPELNYNFPHLRFLHFFITHSVIILTCFFFVWVEKYKVTFRSVLKTMGFLNAAAVLIYFINQTAGGNYMFLSRKPVNPTPLDFLGPYPWYILSLEIVAFLLFLLLFVPFSSIKKKTGISKSV